MSAFDEILEEQKQPEAPQPPAPESVVEAAQPEQPTDVQQPPAEPSGEEAQGLEAVEEKDEAWEAERKAREEKDGDNWAIRGYRENFRTVNRNKDLLSLATQHGPQAVRVGAQIGAVCLDPNAEGAKMVETIRESLPQSQYNKLRDEMTWATVYHEPSQAIILSALCGTETTLEEVKAALAERRHFGPSEIPKEDAQDELAGLPDTVKKKLADYDKVMSQFPDLQKTVQGYEEKTVSAEISQKADELYDSVVSVATPHIEKLPLKDEPTDTEEVKGIKEALRKHFSEDALEEAFLADETNKKNYLAAIEYAKRRDYKAAFEYRDALAVGWEQAVLSKIASPQVKSLLAAYKASRLSTTTPKDPTARPELVQGSTATLQKPDVFADAAKEGITNPFDAVQWGMKQDKGQRAGQA